MVGSTRGGRPSALRDRTRQAMRAEVAEVALRLFDEQGFDGTTVDQIAAEAGLSRATFFRYFGTKEDVVLNTYTELVGEQMVDALRRRPEDERPWESLRRAFDVITELNADEPEKPLRFMHMLDETPSLRARYWEKQQQWQELLVPELARRLGTETDDAELRASALVAAALACMSVATAAWMACDATTPLSTLLDRAMGALGQ